MNEEEDKWLESVKGNRGIVRFVENLSEAALISAITYLRNELQRDFEWVFSVLAWELNYCFQVWQVAEPGVQEFGNTGLNIYQYFNTGSWRTVDLAFKYVIFKLFSCRVCDCHPRDSALVYYSELVVHSKDKELLDKLMSTTGLIVTGLWYQSFGVAS